MKKKSTKKSNRRPFWLTEPCPTWCYGDHKEGDLVADRTHFGLWEFRLPLALQDPEWFTDPETRKTSTDTSVFDLYVSQEWREVEAWVGLNYNESREGSYKLTRNEAERLGKKLLEAVELIDSGSRGNRSRRHRAA